MVLSPAVRGLCLVSERPSRREQRGRETYIQVPQLEEQPPLAFAILACLTGPDGITSLPKNNQTEPISQRSTTRRHRGQETGNVNALPKPAESRAGRGSMRAPGWVPLLSTLLLVRHGSAQDGSENDEDGSGYGTAALPTATVPPPPSAPPTSPASVSSPQPVLVTAGSTEGSLEIESTPSPELSDTSSNGSLETEEPSVLVYAVPALALALLVLLVIIFIIFRNRKKSKQDELGSENVKSPIFEEDTPSVMEIEMEELDKWMNSMNKNADCECLPTVREEEKESVANPSDGES
ncbi:transmembrane protein 154 [Coturnix japonica]|uniref:Transmembrane protein 154 n=1 Tax=Coturnix japonica TaxID=93934 RepID=A0A8C2SZR1_COTJA|nr:transmembrane protein 154 [Coturnix japonica]